METLDQRAAGVKNIIVANKGTMPKTDVAGIALSSEQIRKTILLDMKAAVKQVDSLRAGGKDATGKARRAVDVSWADFVKEKWGFAASDSGSPDSFYQAIGVNPAGTTIENLMTMPDFDEGFRWIVPEVLREAIRLGLRKAPNYTEWIAAEETVPQPTVIMPFINMSAAGMKKLGEIETIPVGTASFGQKTVKLQKVGVGLKMSDEVLQYVSLNILSLFLQDVGVKMNTALDALAIDILINGDQDDGSAAASVIGVTSAGTLDYLSILRAWVRMGRIGRIPQGMISNETIALEALQLAEFKTPVLGEPLKRLSVRTPIPASQNFWIHGAMPATNQLMLIDPTAALIKLNSAALRVESERIVERQLNGTYVTMTTGFANIFDDARLIIDKSLNFSAAGFPASMDVSTLEQAGFAE